MKKIKYFIALLAMTISMTMYISANENIIDDSPTVDFAERNEDKLVENYTEEAQIVDLEENGLESNVIETIYDESTEGSISRKLTHKQKYKKYFSKVEWIKRYSKKKKKIL